MKIAVLILVLLGVAACTALSVWITTGGHLRWRAARGRPAPQSNSRNAAITVVAAVILIGVGIYFQSQP